MDNATRATRDFAITSFQSEESMDWAAALEDSDIQPAEPLRGAIIIACCIVAVTVGVALAIGDRPATTVHTPQTPPPASLREKSGADGQAPMIQRDGAQTPAPETAASSGSKIPSRTRSIGGPEAEAAITPIRAAPTPPAAAPTRIVLTVSSAAQDSKRLADVRRALAAAGLAVASVSPADRIILEPRVAYYFQPDRDAAMSLRETIAPVLGAADVQGADLRAATRNGRPPPPGSIEISIP